MLLQIYIEMFLVDYFCFFLDIGNHFRVGGVTFLKPKRIHNAHQRIVDLKKKSSLAFQVEVV